MNNESETKTYRASIGPSVTVKGEITGEEDILIEGFVEGTVNLKKNAVTVAGTGRVSAHIFGVTVHVEGQVTGDIDASDRVIVHKSGKVIGNITAPKISIEEGAKVKGSICTGDMTDDAPRVTDRFKAPEKTTSVSESDMDLSAQLNRKGSFLKGKEGLTSN